MLYKCLSVVIKKGYHIKSTLDNKSNAAIKSNINRVASPKPTNSLNPVLQNSVKPTLESKPVEKSKNEPVNVQKEIAKASGVSHDTISKVKKLLEKTPEEVKQNLEQSIFSYLLQARGSSPFAIFSSISSVRSSSFFNSG